VGSIPTTSPNDNLSSDPVLDMREKVLVAVGSGIPFKLSL